MAALAAMTVQGTATPDGLTGVDCVGVDGDEVVGVVVAPTVSRLGRARLFASRAFKAEDGGLLK